MYLLSYIYMLVSETILRLIHIITFNHFRFIKLFSFLYVSVMSDVRVCVNTSDIITLFFNFILKFYEQGLTGITICATMSIFVPNQENCDQLSLLLGNCEPAKPWQMTYLYTVLYITAFGAAGTDRLDEVLFKLI